MQDKLIKELKEKENALIKIENELKVINKKRAELIQSLGEHVGSIKTLRKLLGKNEITGKENKTEKKDI